MESLSLAFYRLACRLLQLVVLVFLPFLLLTFGGDANELRQRFGWISLDHRNRKRRLIWIHAASVGEVKAAAVLINKLKADHDKLDFMVSTVTRQGQKVARRVLPPDTDTVFAPLDLPECVSLALKRTKPSLYICLETELWPNMLIQVKKNGCPAMLLNGRMSARSCRRYQRFSAIVRPVIRSLAAIGTITDLDRERYLRLGAERKTTRTCGNIKYDQACGAEEKERSRRYREQLHLSPEDKVLVAGSTHTGEEAMLLDQYRQMTRDIPGFILIIAPRHLERLEEIERELSEREIAFTRFSRRNETKERTRVVLLDTMGDLAAVYGLATWVFCGGSLVDRGGHNIMEAAIHAVPVFYGPSMKDFADAAAILNDCGGGIMIKSAAELRQRITRMTPANEEYRKTAAAAGNAATSQTGAAARQTAMAIAVLEKTGI